MDEPDTHPGDQDVIDLTARRPEVLRRLLDRGVPAHTLRAMFPEWEPYLTDALDEAAPAR